MSFSMAMFESNSMGQGSVPAQSNFGGPSSSIFGGHAAGHNQQSYAQYGQYPTAPAQSCSASASIFGGLSDGLAGGNTYNTYTTNTYTAEPQTSIFSGHAMGAPNPTSPTTAACDYGGSAGIFGSLASAPQPQPRPTATRKRGVRFGGEEVRYITPSPAASDAGSSCANAGFDALGFSSLGSVGEMETFNSRGSWEELTNTNSGRRACAPISASRLVQRRWRSSNAAGRR